MKVSKSLNILMILHMEWSRNLGAARVQLELAECFEAMGHYVEKFDYYDAFPKNQSDLSLKFLNVMKPKFSVKAKAFVQRNAHRFDIIDAHQGKLPFSKKELGFNGLLVARSVGLRALLNEYLEFERSQWPPKTKKMAIAQWLWSMKQKREQPDYLRSFQTCDLINLPNPDEVTYVRKVMGEGDKCVAFPFGLSQKRQQEFIRAIQPASVRLANKTIAFIGTWGPRKGAKDWAKIIQSVREKVEEAQFLFLGTIFKSELVLKDLNLTSSEGIEIVESYDSQDLPKLLGRATVGAFPSYMEGFGFAVLEKLAAGLPTVAYDIPGPRVMLSHLGQGFQVPLGDVEQFSVQLVKLLTLEADRYTHLSHQCIGIAKQFSWEEIARETLEIYTQKLETIRLS